MGNDRRYYGRVVTNVEAIVFSGSEGDKDREEIIAKVIDVSEQGLCIFIDADTMYDHEFEVGEDISFQFVDQFCISKSKFSYCLVKEAVIKNIVQYEDGLRIGLYIYDSEFADYSKKKMLNSYVHIGWTRHAVYA